MTHVMVPVSSVPLFLFLSLRSTSYSFPFLSPPQLVERQSPSPGLRYFGVGIPPARVDLPILFLSL